jgi:hypothetical protein
MIGIYAIVCYSIVFGMALIHSIIYLVEIVTSKFCATRQTEENNPLLTKE